MLAVAVGATLGTRHFQLLSDRFALTDAAALAAIVVFSLGIVARVWSETGAGLGEEGR